MAIGYCKTPLGVAQINTEEGFIVSINILDNETEVKPNDDPVLQNAIKQLEEYFDGKRTAFDLPINQNGTDFQQTVWNQLLKIPFGKTITYSQQSKLMNNPLGIRAIASANGKNNIWVVVPCHRVIGSDGNLTGYAGGLWRKKWLLAHEAKVSGIGQIEIDL